MEANLFRLSPSHKVNDSNFPLGIQEYAFSVGVPNVWHPSKSYFRVAMTLYGSPLGGAVDRPRFREMIAFADNAVGNMFDNAYLKSNNVEISGISQGLTSICSTCSNWKWLFMGKITRRSYWDSRI